MEKPKLDDRETAVENTEGVAGREQTDSVVIG